MKKFILIFIAACSLHFGNAQDVKAILKKMQYNPTLDFNLRGTWVLDSNQVYLSLFPGLPSSLFLKTHYKYNAAAKEIQQTQYSGDLFNPTAPLLPSAQITTTYNAQNLASIVTEKQYDTGTSTWVNYRKTINTYSGNLKSSVLVQNWQNNTWIDTSRNQISYNSKSLEITNLGQNYDPIAKVWVNNSLDSSKYDASNRLIEFVSLEFDVIANAWVYSTKTVNKYIGTTTNIGESSEYTWNDPNWEIESKSTYTYTNNQISEILIKGLDDNGDLVDQGKVVNTFDSNGNIKNSKFYVVDENGEVQEFLENKYFWSMLTGLNDVFVNKYQCQIPNPYSSGQTIRCQGTNENSAYTLQLVGLNGQVHSVGAINPASFSLENNQLNGLYWLRILEDNKAVNQDKLLILNK